MTNTEVGQTWAPDMAAGIGQTVADLRRQDGMSAQALADRCSGLGYPIARGSIAKLENGRRESVTVPELVVLAAALGVAPVDLLFPGAKATRHVDEDGYDVAEPTFEYVPGDTIPAREAWSRFVGTGGTPASVRIGQARRLIDEAGRLLGEVQ